MKEDERATFANIKRTFWALKIIKREGELRRSLVVRICFNEKTKGRDTDLKVSKIALKCLKVASRICLSVL